MFWIIRRLGNFAHALGDRHRLQHRQIQPKNALKLAIYNLDFIHFQTAQTSSSPKCAKRAAGGFRLSVLLADMQKAIRRQRQLKMMDVISRY